MIDFSQQKELDLPVSQVLGLFNRIIRKFVQLFNSISEAALGEGIPAAADAGNEPVKISIDKELVREKMGECTIIITPCFVQSEAADMFEEEQARKRAELQAADLSCYAVGGAEEEWVESLSNSQPSIVSVR